MKERNNNQQAQTQQYAMRALALPLLLLPFAAYSSIHSLLIGAGFSLPTKSILQLITHTHTRIYGCLSRSTGWWPRRSSWRSGRPSPDTAGGTPVRVRVFCFCTVRKRGKGINHTYGGHPAKRGRHTPVTSHIQRPTDGPTSALQNMAAGKISVTMGASYLPEADSLSIPTGAHACVCTCKGESCVCLYVERLECRW